MQALRNASFLARLVLVARMPEQAGPLYWPVRQLCEEGRLDGWTSRKAGTSGPN